MIAHRRPSFYLAPRGRDELDRMTDSHLRVLTQAGVIEAPLRDAALAQKLAFRDPRSQPTVQPLPTNKGVTLARTRLAGMLGVPLYDLDRLDLRANTTLQHELQESVTAYLQKLADPDYAAQLGLIGERLLTPTSTRSVRYSFTLFERTPSGNQVRVQTDNTDQPFDINEGSKLELGSTAKLRVLASYLETVAQIHRDYGGMSVAELRKVEVEPLDFILRWGIDHLVASRDRDLSAMLQAAMERRYSASPYESFFTGGGLHTFNNFRKEDNGRRPMLLEALRESINLPFVRLLRDLIRHDIYQNAGSKVQLLADDKDPRRADYLDRFVDKESQVYLRRFWVKYRDKDANQRLETFLDGLRPWPVRLAAIHRYLQPQADLASFSAFLRERLPRGSLTDKRAAELYERYGPGKFNLNDQGYVARVHPLELWLLGYLQKQPQATFGEAVAASGAERKEVYGWLFKSRHKNARDKRIRILLEVEAFLDLHQQWKKLGYPFDHLVPSYATALGSSGDRPAALAELMGIIVNDGVRMPTLRLEHLDFALGTPYETRFAPEATLGQRVMTSEVAATLRNALSQVVDAGTARRLQGTFSRPDGAPLVMGGKTGTGDNRLQTFSAGGHVRSSKALNRTATFVFYIGPRHRYPHRLRRRQRVEPVRSPRPCRCRCSRAWHRSSGTTSTHAPPPAARYRCRRNRSAACSGSAHRPVPGRPVQLAQPLDAGLAEVLLQPQRMAFRVFFERRDKPRGVRHHQHLGVLRGLADQAPEGRQQVGMQAGFRFVEHQQRRRPRRQQGGDPQQVAQGAVRQLRGAQRPQQAGLLDQHVEAPSRVVDVQAAAGKGIVHRLVQRRRIADLADGLQGRGQVGAVGASTGVWVPICGRRAGASASLRKWS